jgi:uncharacterized protein (UPF0332 family)
MRAHDFQRILSDPAHVETRVGQLCAEGVLRRQPVDPAEVSGHQEKAEHNLRFVKKAAELGFLDWAVTGCYYSAYHAALALILMRGYSSKNHVATLLVLVKEYYRELTRDEIAIYNELLDYQDILFYVESKRRREDATYSTRLRFDRQDVEQLRIKAALFVSKARSVLASS